MSFPKLLNKIGQRGHCCVLERAFDTQPRYVYPDFQADSTNMKTSNCGSLRLSIFQQTYIMEIFDCLDASVSNVCTAWYGVLAALQKVKPKDHSRLCSRECLVWRKPVNNSKCLFSTAFGAKDLQLLKRHKATIQSLTWAFAVILFAP